MYKVAVLMSTYNGEKYIREQLESIFNQENVDLELVVRDDGSSDKTIDILEEYKNRGYSIEIVKGNNIGVALSFWTLIEMHVQADYYAFSDQDDIWEPRKLEAAISSIESILEPCLYYSALSLVDQNGLPLQKEDIQPIRATGENAIYGFYATGCTMVFNKELHQILCMYTPSKFYLHDAWIVCVAAYLGRIIVDSRSYIKYRQHETNVVGMRKNVKIKKRITNFFYQNAHRHEIIAKQLISGYGEKMTSKRYRQIENVALYRESLMSVAKLIVDIVQAPLSFRAKLSCLRGIIFRVF